MTHIRKLGEPRIEEDLVQEPSIVQMKKRMAVTVDSSAQVIQNQMVAEVEEITKTVDALKDNEAILKELGITLPNLSITNSMSTANTMADLMLDAIALKAKFGKKAKGDPRDVYNMLPEKLKHIDIIKSAKEIENRTSTLTASERKLITKLAKIYKLREETWDQPIEKIVSKLEKELPNEPIEELDNKLDEATATHTHIEEEPIGELVINEDKDNSKTIPFNELKRRIIACTTLEDVDTVVADIENNFDGISDGDINTAATLIKKHKEQLKSVPTSPINASVFEDVNIDVPVIDKKIKEAITKTVPETLEKNKDVTTPVVAEPVEEPTIAPEKANCIKEEPAQKTPKTEVEGDSTEQTISDVIDEDNPMCATAFGRLAFVYLKCAKETHVVTPDDIDEIADKLYACDCVTEKVADELINDAVNQIVEDNAKAAANSTLEQPEDTSNASVSEPLPEYESTDAVSTTTTQEADIKQVVEPKPLEQAPAPIEVESVESEPEAIVEEPTPGEQVVESKHDKVREYDLLIELFGELNNTDITMLNYGDVGMLLSSINIDTLKSLEHKLVYKEAKAKYES